MTENRYKKKILKLQEKLFDLQHSNDLLRQDNEAFQEDIDNLMIELAETRQAVDEKIAELEKDIESVKSIKEKYKKAVLSTRKAKAKYSKDMKELLRNFKNEIN